MLGLLFSPGILLAPMHHFANSLNFVKPKILLSSRGTSSLRSRQSLPPRSIFTSSKYLGKPGEDLGDETPPPNSSINSIPRFTTSSSISICFLNSNLLFYNNFHSQILPILHSTTCRGAHCLMSNSRDILLARAHVQPLESWGDL